MSDVLDQWEAEMRGRLDGIKAYEEAQKTKINYMNVADEIRIYQDCLTLIAAYREQQEILKQKDEALSFAKESIMMASSPGVDTVLLRVLKSGLALQPKDIK